MAVGCADAFVVGAAGRVGDVLDECALEAPAEDLLLGIDEDAHTFGLEAVDDAGAEVDNLLIDIAHVEACEVARYLVAPRRLEIGHEELARVGRGEDAQLVGVLDVHDLVADVVGGLHEIDEGEAGVAQGAWRRAEALYAELGGYALVVGALGLEEAELQMFSGEVAGEGVFDYAGQRAIGHDEAPGSAAVEVVGEEAEGVGVALEVGEVVPLQWREAVARLGVLEGL